MADDPITLWLGKLRKGDPRAVEQIVSRYYQPIVRYIRKHRRIRHGAKKVFGSYLNLQGKGNSAEFNLRVNVAEDDTIDFVVDPYQNYPCDSTGLEATITLQ